MPMIVEQLASESATGMVHIDLSIEQVGRVDEVSSGIHTEPEVTKSSN